MSTTTEHPRLPLPEGIKEFYLPSHDLTYHILAAGNPKKPLVLCLHGFPELAFSWRKIMPAIAAEGYYVVAYDQRGYGYTTGWDTRKFADVDLHSFTPTRVVRDAVILINALGYREVACVIGHDFGSVGASMCAVMRPDLFKSVVMMSHPFKGTPSLPFDTVSSGPSDQPPVRQDIQKELANLPEPRKHYKLYYSTENAAAEMENPQDTLREFLRGYYHLKSADWEGNEPQPLQKWNASELSKLPYYYVMPLKAGMREAVQTVMAKEDPEVVAKRGDRWLPDHELQVYVDAFRHNGFQGGLNYYRVGSNSEYMKEVELFAGRKIDIPSLFISGKEDWGTYQEPGSFENMKEVCTRYKGGHLIDGAGHWVQQERPDNVSELVANFLRQINVDAISH